MRCRAVSCGFKKFNAKLAQDKSRGIRQGDDFVPCALHGSRKNPRQTFTVQAMLRICTWVSTAASSAICGMAEKLPVPENRNILPPFTEMTASTT